MIDESIFRWVFAELSTVAGYRLYQGQSPDDPHPETGLHLKRLVRAPASATAHMWPERRLGMHMYLQAHTQHSNDKKKQVNASARTDAAGVAKFSDLRFTTSGQAFACGLLHVN